METKDLLQGATLRGYNNQFMKNLVSEYQGIPKPKTQQGRAKKMQDIMGGPLTKQRKSVNHTVLQ